MHIEFMNMLQPIGWKSIVKILIGKEEFKFLIWQSKNFEEKHLDPHLRDLKVLKENWTMTKMKTVIEVGIVIGYAALLALAIIGLYCNPDVLSVGM